MKKRITNRSIINLQKTGILVAGVSRSRQASPVSLGQSQQTMTQNHLDEVIEKILQVMMEKESHSAVDLAAKVERVMANASRSTEAFHAEKAKAVEKESHSAVDLAAKAERVMANASRSTEVFHAETAKAVEKENHLTVDLDAKAERVMANANRSTVDLDGKIEKKVTSVNHSIVVFHAETGKAQQSVNHFQEERENHLEKDLWLLLMEKNYQKLHQKKEKFEDTQLIQRK